MNFHNSIPGALLRHMVIAISNCPWRFSFWSPQARGDSQHDLLFFLSRRVVLTISPTAVSSVRRFLCARYFGRSVCILTMSRFRFLGEYIWSTSESEMERFKLGWQATRRHHDLVGAISHKRKILDNGIPPRPIHANQYQPAGRWKSGKTKAAQCPPTLRDFRLNMR